MSEETKDFQYSREDFVTPDQLNDDLEYSEEEIKEFDDMISQTLNDLSEGEVVLGKIIRISKQDVAIDIGFKSEGVIDIEEFDNPEELNEGDEIDVFLESVDDGFGSVVLSHKKAEFMKVWEGVVATYENEEVITGKCMRRIKGGMVVDVKGIDAFLPGSQIDVKAIRDFDAYIGKEMDFKIVKLNHARKNVVVSHRVLIEKDMEALRAEILDTLEKGQVREGMVKNITDFGVFIDLGGVDGLLHITDLSWGRVNHPSEIVKLDQKIEVKILDYNEKKDRISLGLKQLMPHPWEKIDEKYPVGSTVNGRVVSITDYGAFVELEKGIEGLIHISEMSWSQHIKHPSQVLKIGQETEVRVLNIDPEDKKISLGIKQLEPDPWEKLEDRYPAGSVHDGKVRNLTAFGAFVELEEGVDGLVHISDLSWTKKIRHPGEVVKKGDEIKVKVLDINREERRIALGHKQVEPNPWDHFEDLFKVGKTVDGTIARMVDKGIVVTLEMGVDGFVPLNHLADKNAKKALESINIGDVMQLKVIEFDKENKRIVLSARALKESEDKATLSGYKPDDKPATIGDFAKFELKMPEEEKTEEKAEAKAEAPPAEDVKEEKKPAAKKKATAKKAEPKAEAKAPPAEDVKEEKKPAAKKAEPKAKAEAEDVKEEKKPAAKKAEPKAKAEAEEVKEEKKPAAKKKATAKKVEPKAKAEVVEKEKKPAAKKKATPKKTTAKDKD